MSNNGDDELERRLRDVLHSRGLGVPVSPDAIDRIHTGARRRQQRRSATGILSAVVIIAVAVVGIGVNAHDHGPAITADDHTPSPLPASSSGPSTPSTSPTAPPASPASTPSSVISGGVVEPTAPAAASNDFHPVSVTAVGPSTYWVLLAGNDCSCMELKMTSDGGQTFATLDAPAGIGAKGWMVTDIRFANASDGWGFGDADSSGPQLFATTNGGRSWSEVSQFAGAVVDLVAANNKAWAVVDTTPENQQVPAQFALYETSYGQAPEVWTRVSLPIDLGALLPSIVDQDGTVTLLAAGPLRSGNHVHALVIKPDGSISDYTGPCSQDLGGWLSGSAKAIWAVCPTGNLAGVSVSTDRGATWRAVMNLPPPSLPDPGNGGLGAIDDQHAVIYDAGLPGLVRVSTNAAPVDVASGIGPTAGTSFIGFTTPSIGFAIANTGSTAATGLWRTTDGGTTWASVQFPPTAAVGSSATSSAAVPPCSQGDLQLSNPSDVGGGAGGMGNLVVALVFRNVGTSTCSMIGWPTVARPYASTTVLYQTSTGAGFEVPVSRVVLAPGATASSSLDMVEEGGYGTQCFAAGAWSVTPPLGDHAVRVAWPKYQGACPNGTVLVSPVYLGDEPNVGFGSADPTSILEIGPYSSPPTLSHP